MSQSNEAEVMLTLEEFGILCFTNSYYLDDELKNKVEVILTSSQTYFWVPVISHLIKSTELSIEDIRVFVELSLNNLVTKNEARWNNRALGVEGMLATLESVLFYTTRLKFDNPVLEHQSLFGSFIDEISERLEDHNLIEANQIEVLNGAPGVMMGLLPLGFTKRTRVGEDIFTKFQNQFRDMEVNKTIKDSPYENHYRFFRVYELFRSAIFTMEEEFGTYKNKKSKQK
ncbi:hypothetical protein [Reichenbachiella versicolor]|uniref:hypothetical protein n=1 Tax=Reichenbachiella versicolor TaxID=1821036 RepID=UPI000D6E1D3E|nr:hypothetical protein [Reichenbachiella versicolor]